MADLTKNTFTDSVAVQTLVAAAAGQQVANWTAKDLLIVKNADGSDHTITIDSVLACDQGEDHNLAIVVAAGTTAIIIPESPARRWRDSSGKLSISWSSVTGMTVGCFTLPN